MAPCLKLVISVLFLIAFGAQIPGSSGHVHEKKLLSTLFNKYKTEMRPVYYPQDTLKVKLGVAFLHLLDLNVKQQHMVATVWIRLVWKDASLKWDENQYGNISVLRVRPSMVWVPDLVLHNTADDQNKIPKRTNVLIYPSGEVLWVPPAAFKVKCTADPTLFPFDRQTCLMKFGSASYNGREISFSLYNDRFHADLSDYWKNDQWEVVEVPAFHNVYQSPVEVYSTEEVVFYFTFQRRVTNYVVTLLLLSILLAIITVLPFILPDEKSEKLILELGSLVGALVILMHLNQMIDRAHMSIMAKYLLTVVALNLVSIVCTVGGIYFSLTHKPVPEWIQKYVLVYPGKILIWKRTPKSKTTSAPPSAIEDASELNKSADEDKTPTTNEQKWKLLALIMDRGLFLIYLLVIVISTAVLLSERRSVKSEDAVIRSNMNDG